MIRIVTLFVCLVLLPQVAWADDAPKPKAVVAKAEVVGDKCTFKFPIEDMERDWKWGVSPANHLEYSWMVTVKNGDTTYQLGYSYFNPDAVPQSGKFAELLRSGQANVWELDAEGAGATYVEAVSVNCRPERDHLQIVVHDKAWTEKLFGAQPQTVQFEARGALLKPTKTTVTVDYVRDHKNSDG